MTTRRSGKHKVVVRQRLKKAPCKILLVTVTLLLSSGYSPSPARAEEPQLRVGSKSFVESVILGEMLCLLGDEVGAKTNHRNLGGTPLLWEALRAKEIDVYVEYTGTLLREIFSQKSLKDDAGLRRVLAEAGIAASLPLGFNNTYAIGMREDRAESLGITRISDLRDHPQLSFGFSNEFLNRGDGWPSLQQRYDLPQQRVRGMEHELAYRALAAGSVDAIDVYSTDGDIAYYSIRLLQDDLRHFPDYQAIILYRQSYAERLPQVIESLQRLQGQISEADMTRLNRRVVREGETEREVAGDFLRERLNVDRPVVRPSRWWLLAGYTGEHLVLVGVSLFSAVVVAIPLGIAAAKFPRLGQGIVGTVGVLQTIPSLALLVITIPLLGTGFMPAVFALFIYSLLPIVRNTHAGLTDIPPTLRESAEALGLGWWDRLWRIELPMASRHILAGIKISAVLNIGTATLGGIIGAGGLGDPIMTGIRSKDNVLVLQAALLAAGLAIVAQGIFEIGERFLVPRGLRIRSQP